MLALLPLLLAAAPAPASAWTGSWDLDVAGTTIFRLEIVNTPDGVAATWVRPTRLDIDGDGFSNLIGPAVSRKGTQTRMVEGDAEFSFDDPRPKASPDVLHLHRIDADHIDVTYQGLGVPAFHFVRSKPHPAALGSWDSRRSYFLGPPRPSNPEMTAIYDADQADRQMDFTRIDWSVVEPADEKRRKRTQELLDAGQLQSAEDYSGAAFVFQHGSKPEDFLKAHLLAMVAVARGKPSALWIASAALDRYLQSIGKPQVLGTQSMLPAHGPMTQEPYNRTLISDAMRQAVGVDTLAEQEQKLKDQQARVDADKAAPASNPQSGATP